MTLLTGIMELLSVNVLFILIIYNIVVDFLKLERLFGAIIWSDYLELNQKFLSYLLWTLTLELVRFVIKLSSHLLI